MTGPRLAGQQKKWHDRATRLKRALFDEKSRFGQIDDGCGKRFLIGPLYVLCSEVEEALGFYEWYEKELPGERGDPLHYFFWALALHRDGDLKRADAKLLETMVQNIYLLPALLGSPPEPHDIWHGSNWDEPGYLAGVPEDLLPQLSDGERSWIKEQLDSAPIRRVLEEYISAHRALEYERDIGERRKILKRWAEFLAGAREFDGCGGG